MAVLAAAAQGTIDADAVVRRLLDWCSWQLAVQARLIQPTAPWRRGDEELHLLDLGEASTQVAEVAAGRGERPVQVPEGLVLPAGRPERRELLVVLRALLALPMPPLSRRAGGPGSQACPG